MIYFFKNCLAIDMKIASNYLNFVNSSLLDRLRILAILLSKFKRFNQILFPPEIMKKPLYFS